MDKKRVKTPLGTMAYLEEGPPDAPPILFVHGIPTSSFLWRHVIHALSDRFRCVAPDLPGLGDTEVDPDTTDFAMPAQARALEDFLDALEIDRAHVVAHDQGGAAAQILVTSRPSRVERLVLSDVVCFDNWPVPVIARLQRLARLPWVADTMARTGAMELIEKTTRLSAFRRGVSDPTLLPDEAIAEYLRPLRASAASRKRFLAFLLAGRARYTMAVVPALRALTIPTLILWAAEDRYIPPEWGRRLYETIGGAARFEIIGDCGHFWPEERPEAFADKIGAFLSEPAKSRRDEPLRLATAPGVPPTKEKQKCPAAPPRARKQEAKP